MVFQMKISYCWVFPMRDVGNVVQCIRLNPKLRKKNFFLNFLIKSHKFIFRKYISN